MKNVRPTPRNSDRFTLRQSFSHAFAGILYAVRSQRSMKIHLCFALFALVMCVVLRAYPHEWVIVVILIGIVLAAELLNTSLEALVDLSSPDIHPLAKVAKDTAAAAVLVLAFVAVVAGSIIYSNAFLRLLG